jgi:hypothetical protein
MKTCRWVLLFAPLLTCLCGCTLLMLMSAVSYPYSFHAEITVADLSGTQLWNRAPEETVEYAWGLKIDWDANATTGEPPDGMDYEITVRCTSDGTGNGESVISDEIMFLASTAQISTRLTPWVDGVWESTSASDETSYASGNTIGLLFNAEGGMPAPAAGFRTRFLTSHYPPPSGPAVPDDTSIITGSTSTGSQQ